MLFLWLLIFGLTHDHHDADAALDSNDTFWNQKLRISRFNCDGGIKVCEQKKFVLNLSGTLSNPTHDSGKNICSLAKSMVDMHDCFLGVSKVIQMWFLHRLMTPVLAPQQPELIYLKSHTLIHHLSDFYSSFHHLEKVNVCISGPFSIEILILILLQLNHKMYDIKFYFTKEEYDNIKGDNFLNFLKSSTANQRVGYTISKISINEQCDILHFRDNHDTRTILTELQINVVAPIYIIWENNYTRSHHME